MTVEEVAVALGMSYAVLHSRIIARSAFSADEIRILLHLLPEQRLAPYLLDGTKIVEADRETVDSDQSVLVNGSIQRGATKVVVDAAEILELVDSSLAGEGSTIEASPWSAKTSPRLNASSPRSDSGLRTCEKKSYPANSARLH